jgi:hypothetical protein
MMSGDKEQCAGVLAGGSGWVDVPNQNGRYRKYDFPNHELPGNRARNTVRQHFATCNCISQRVPPCCSKPPACGLQPPSAAPQRSDAGSRCGSSAGLWQCAPSRSGGDRHVALPHCDAPLSLMFVAVCRATCCLHHAQLAAMGNGFIALVLFATHHQEPTALNTSPRPSP